MPGVYVLVAHTHEEAKKQQQLLDELVDDDIGLGLLGRMLGNFDLSDVDVNEPLASLDLSETQTGQQSRQQLIQALGQEQGLTIKQLYQRIASGRGHFVWLERQNILPISLKSGSLVVQQMDLTLCQPSYQTELETLSIWLFPSFNSAIYSAKNTKVKH